MKISRQNKEKDFLPPSSRSRKDYKGHFRLVGGYFNDILHFTFVHLQHCIQNITAWCHH